MSIRFYRRQLKFLSRLPNTSAIHTKRSIASVGSRPNLRCNFPMWMLKSARSAVLNGWASRGCLSQSVLPLVMSARPGRQRAGSFQLWPAAAVRAETHRVRPLGCCERFFCLCSLCRTSHEGMELIIDVPTETLFIFAKLPEPVPFRSPLWLSAVQNGLTIGIKI